MSAERRIRVGVNGYGAIGKRVADAVLAQEDMALAGVADVATDWRPAVAREKHIELFGGDAEHASAMTRAGLEPAGELDDLLERVDVIVDCTPKRVGARNAQRYREAEVKFVLQGGEKHEVTGHSFVADANYSEAVGLECTRVVSCNTTSIVRTLTALKREGLLASARGTLLRRATDPWESHLGGIMNTVVPELTIPSHQAPDAQTVDPDLDVVTMAVKVPETLAHVHFWCVRLARPAERETALEALRSSSRIAFVRGDAGLGAINAIKELAMDQGRRRGDVHEVVVWEDVLSVVGDELYYAYMVDNQAIVIPETIDAVRALSGTEPSAEASIRMTDAALGVRGGSWSVSPGGAGASAAVGR
ncbi:MAG: type II glyceraldehyde-3-phosphate dehydrogenase [Gemmatimonadales bacterium]